MSVRPFAGSQTRRAGRPLFAQDTFERAPQGVGDSPRIRSTSLPKLAPVASAGAAGPGDLDVAQLRADTPGCADVVHLNNAGSALPPSPVVEGVERFNRLESLVGGYAAEEAERDAVERPYGALARLLNCDEEEIAVVQSATSAWQQVVFGMDFQPGDRILTSVAEYGSNFINYLQLAKRRGISIDVVCEEPSGDISLENLEELLTGGPAPPKLISISHIPTSSGRVYDAEGVGRLASQYGVPFLLDACQSVGQLPVDARRLNCTFLSGTSRKYLRGPRGAGFLFVAKSALDAGFEPCALDVRSAQWTSREGYKMRSDARRCEQFEMSVAAKVGLGVAVKYALDVGLEAMWHRIRHLAGLLRSRLGEIRGVQTRDVGPNLCGIVSFDVEGVDAAEVAAALKAERISVSVSGIDSSRLDFEKRGLRDVVRASVHYYNEEWEIERVGEAVQRLMKRT
ncbi:unnamed protein product [Ostreobium quekettii]|uniref:Aminotransferase class V domain-containing protein n=1 Tax=Ostreobium quekettii TaxID=121088 RepID=A0A8S1J5U3_9CHLO|nr:unnamed protein product [Ostreobium quekettii]|eukprot:evm.model.scf_520.4 EVM.evm.TU.scf_520.4   scf_520:53921-56113(+)